MSLTIEKLSKSLIEPNAAFLVESEISRYYLTGFKSSDGAVLITRNASYFLVDFRYGEAALKTVKDIKVIVYDKMTDILKTLIGKHKVKQLYLEMNTTVERLSYLKKQLLVTNIKLICDGTLDKLINNMRLIKTRTEINKIKEAQRITEEAFRKVLGFIKVGVTEREIALFLEFEMRKNGASAVAFDLISITGANTSLPHGVPSNKKVENGDFITMDIGAVYDGYHSDMTRTVAIGDITEKQIEIYNIVLKAQLCALSAVKAGVSAEYVDSKARNIISENGYGEFYKHSTGHGVGLQIHEQPFITLKNKTLLSSGMVITIEPGIYLPNKFGVRIEDMVCVTKNGCTNLTSIDKKLVIL